VKRRPVLPGPDIGRLLLDHLVAEGVRYGRDFSLVRISVPLGTAEDVAPRLGTVLRDADVLIRWESDELLALLPETDHWGAERAAERLRAGTDDTPIGLGAAHWAGESARDLLARAQPH